MITLIDQNVNVCIKVILYPTELVQNIFFKIDDLSLISNLVNNNKTITRPIASFNYVREPSVRRDHSRKSYYAVGLFNSL